MLSNEVQTSWLPNGEFSLCLVLETNHSNPKHDIPVIIQRLVLQLRQVAKLEHDIIPGQDSITIVADNDESLLYLKQQLELLLLNLPEHEQFESTIHELAICYDERLSTDLGELSQRLCLDREAIIKRHLMGTYRLDMLGFLPGFFYLSGLHKSLILTRKDTPSVQVPKGSVAIAEQMCGIYSLPSPGGWWTIGRTPDQLFDINKTPPVTISPLDEIRFKPICYEQFLEFNHD